MAELRIYVPYEPLLIVNMMIDILMNLYGFVALIILKQTYAHVPKVTNMAMMTQTTTTTTVKQYG